MWDSNYNLTKVLDESRIKEFRSGGLDRLPSLSYLPYLIKNNHTIPTGWLVGLPNKYDYIILMLKLIIKCSYIIYHIQSIYQLVNPILLYITNEVVRNFTYV